MTIPRLVIYRNTNAPSVRIRFKDLDLTGSLIEFVVTPAAASATTFSTDEGSVVLEDTDTAVWTFTQTFANTLSQGVSARLDIYRTLGGVKEKLGAFEIQAGGVGDYFEPDCTVVEVPGVQGLKGDAATVEVGSVSTLDPGESAVVTNVGTPHAAIFNFGIPRGATGIVESIEPGDGIDVDSTDPAHPVVSVGGDVVRSIVPGLGIDVDATDPANPVVAVDYLDKIVTVPSITALKALDTTKYAWAFLFHGQRWGFFQWQAGDFSAFITSDTAEGIFVKADAIASTAGAWQRVGDWRTTGIFASWFGVVGDSAGTTGSGTDNASAINAALSLMNDRPSLGAARLVLPAGTIRCASTITVTGKARCIAGQGMGLPDAWPDPVIPSRSTGTWLYFDHTGIGIRFQDGVTNPQWASRVEGLTTMRNQPTPAPGWAPTVHGADFSMSLHSVHFENVGTLNPYIAFDMNRAPCSFNHIRGQPLRTFAAVDNTGDVCRWNDVHLWPYWSLSEYVATYTRSNLWIFDLGRADNAQLSNIFSIRQAIGIRAWAGTGVGPQRLKGTNVEFDQGGSGLVVSDGTSGLIMQFTNFVTYIEATLAANTRGIQIEGTGHNIQINGLDVSNSGANAILVQGTSNKLGVCNYRLYNYGENTTDSPGIYVGGTGNRIVLEGEEDVSSPNSTVKYFTTGTDCAIVGDDWRSYTPAITASTGSITTVSSVVGRFRRNLKSVDFHVRFLMSNNGTGAGKLRVSIPEAAANPSMVTGIQVNNGYALSGDIAASGTYAEVVRYDGTYPGVNSTVVIVSGTYSVA